MHDSGESQDVSVCHRNTINMTSPFLCRSHDSSVCQSKCDSTWNSVHPSGCPSSVLSIQPSAYFMVIIPMISPGQNFPKLQFTGKLLSVHTSLDSSVDPSGSPSITSLLKTHQNSPVIMCEKCSELPA